MQNDFYETRKGILYSMTSYIIENGDEDVYAYWIEVFPDEPTDDDIFYIAHDDELWTDVVERFAECCKMAGIID